MVDLRLLTGPLFRSTNCITFLSSAAFLGMLFLVPLYFQDARGLSALQSGLSTLPEALGVMAGAQISSRILYPTPGPAPTHHRWSGGIERCLLIFTQISVTTNLWPIRVLMFGVGLTMAQSYGP
jgi:hypothetical protein